MPIVRASRSFWPALHYCLQNNLIAPVRNCPDCSDIPMKMSNERRENLDGAIWRCSKCRKYVSIRHETMFAGIKITIMEQMRIIFHYFVRNYNAMQTTSELRELTGITAYRTVALLYRYVRTQVHIWI